MVEFNKEGYIHKGEMSGFYIKIVPDIEGTGGYYVLYSRDFSQITAEGYDEWYLDIEVINRLLSEIDVEWKN